MILSGLSESLSAGRLASKFHVDVEIKDHGVPYRETVTGVCQAEYLHKKQTSGSGQYARLALIVDGAAPRNYIAAVENGVVESLPRGTFPLTNLYAPSNRPRATPTITNHNHKFINNHRYYE